MFTDKSGKFQLKSTTEADRMEKEREENTKRLSKKYIQQRSILERESTIQRFKSFSNVPRPSKEHTQSWGHDPDEVGKDLDYIPTKDVPDDRDELYAKIDKSNKPKDSKGTAACGNNTQSCFVKLGHPSAKSSFWGPPLKIMIMQVYNLELYQYKQNNIV